MKRAVARSEKTSFNSPFISLHSISEHPLDRYAACDALTLALPPVQMEVIAHAAALRCEAVTEFEQCTPALQRRTGRTIALIGGVCRTVKLVLPRQPRIELRVRRIVMRPSCAKPHAM